MKSKRQFNRIKVVLVEKRRTNLWLANKLNVNKTTVSKWCTNDVQPTIENLFKIAKVLEIEAKELLTTKIEIHE